MTDDQGYGISGTFGGVIPTPNMDRIAKMGLRYTQFHSTALCSPSRAALITGRNHHSVGFGVIAEQATGLPRLRLHDRRGQRHGRQNPPGQRLCHLVVRQEPQHARSTNTAWPGLSTNGRVGMGFDYFYGFMGGETDQWTPWLFRDHTQIFPWKEQPGLQPDHAEAGAQRIRPAVLQPDHRHGGDAIRYIKDSTRPTRQAVLPLLRARRHPCAASADAGVDR